MDGEELTEQETALYDRQIRVWGADAQRRLGKSHILISGLKGTVVEFCKNIVLAGVGSVTLNDDRVATEELLAANFLIPADESVFSSGKSLAELCCDSLKDFNPMVRVSVEKGELSNFNVDFFQKFDAVVIGSCSISTKISVNENCRKLSKRIAFYMVDCKDSCGEIFVDLQDYIYNKKKGDEMEECHLEYPSLKEAISVPWKSLPRRMSKLYFALRVIEKFEELEGRGPGETSSSDLPNVLKLRKELCDKQSLNESQIPDSLLERLLDGGRIEFPPVCAIIGGILGQEVIKAISGKGDPLKNFFFYDMMDGKGIIEDTVPPPPPPPAPPVESSQGSTTSRTLIRPVGTTTFEPDSAVKRISVHIKSKYDEPWTCFSEVPQHVQAMWFGEFKNEFQWAHEDEDAVEKIWHKKAAEKLRGALCDMRRDRSKARWLAPGVRAALFHRFATDERFKTSSAINKQNISASTLTPHRGGSISVTEHRQRARAELGREVAIPELFEQFNFNQEQQTWANERAAAAFETYTQLRDAQLSQGEDGLNEDALFYKATGGRNKKGRSYGFGSELAHYSQGSNEGTSSSQPSASQITQQIEELRQELRQRDEGQERMEGELRALREFVAQLAASSGAPGSSSTPPGPPPANDM